MPTLSEQLRRKIVVKMLESSNMPMNFGLGNVALFNISENERKEAIFSFSFQHSAIAFYRFILFV